MKNRHEYTPSELSMTLYISWYGSQGHIFLDWDLLFMTIMMTLLKLAIERGGGLVMYTFMLTRIVYKYYILLFIKQTKVGKTVVLIYDIKKGSFGGYDFI